MEILVPLNKLKFGQDDGAGINARVAGRQEGIAELAANLHAIGQIENLVVKPAGGDYYAVSNGNRRLAAFHMIYSETSTQPIRCTVHEVDEKTAFEHSLTTAVTARQLHPVDQYEAFARLEEQGKTLEEIGKQYGMTLKEVRQALALGRLSPKIRDVWRRGEIKAEVARAFTLAIDHKTQDKVFAKLQKSGYLWESMVKKELGADATDEDVAELVDVVGAEAYRARGGSVIEDLFGTSHIVTDVPLLQAMAIEVLEAKCEQLKAEGWGWVSLLKDLPHGARWWPQSQPKEKKYERDEPEVLGSLRAQLEAIHDAESTTEEDDDKAEKLEAEIERIEDAARLRSIDAKKRGKLGCIVDVEQGAIVVLYGVKKPEEASSSSRGDVATTGKKAGKGGKTAEPEISQALLHRLSVQLTKAAGTALLQDEQLALSLLIAGVGCYSDCGVKISVTGLGVREEGERALLGAEDMARALPLATRLKPAERIALLTQMAASALDFQNCSLADAAKDDGPLVICNAIDPAALNAALRGVFDAKDYFAGVNKALCLAAITEAMGADMARQQAKKPKGEIAEFAVVNVPPTGWLPPQLRAKGYDGPPVAKGKVPAKATAKPTDRKKKPPRKAAPAKKAAKKAVAKKRKAS